MLCTEVPGEAVWVSDVVEVTDSDMERLEDTVGDIETDEKLFEKH